MENWLPMKSSTEVMKLVAGNYFNNECFVTRKKWEPRGFVIHHIEEIEHDVLRRNYPKGEKGRERYLNDLLPLIETPLTEEQVNEYRNRIEILRYELNVILDEFSRHPVRFALLKNFVHTRLDHIRYGTTRFPIEQRLRFVVLALLTVHRRRKK